MKRFLLGMVIVAMAFVSCEKVQAQKANPENEFEAHPIDGGKAIEITNYVGEKQNVVIPSKIRGLPVTAIGYGAFADKNLTSVVIPNSVTKIGGEAFAYNQLTSVTIPNGVTEIGGETFSTNQLTSVTTIWEDAFTWNQLTNVTIPSSVKFYAYDAFHHPYVADASCAFDGHVQIIEQ